jgi:creatinine amidohydrolase
MANDQPWLLSATTYSVVRSTPYEVAVLPWGATEAHNYHLPYGTDNVEAASLALEAARRAWGRNARVVVLPQIPYGVQTGQRDIPLDINMNPSTQLAVLRDVVASLECSGIKKLVILNGHGANNFRQMILELAPLHHVLVLEANFFRVPHGGIVELPGDHADEFETSLMMHIAPELVAPRADAGDGKDRKFAIQGLREGWAWTQRQWSQVTKDTGVGDPARSTAEKGKQLFETITAQLTTFLVDLANTPVDEMYADA